MRALAPFLRNSLLCSSLRVPGLASLKVVSWFLAATRVQVSFYQKGRESLASLSM